MNNGNASLTKAKKIVDEEHLVTQLALLNGGPAMDGIELGEKFNSKPIFCRAAYSDAHTRKYSVQYSAPTTALHLVHCTVY